MIFEPEDFIARRSALVVKPRAQLTRYHGVFAPAIPHRARIVRTSRAGGGKLRVIAGIEEPAVISGQEAKIPKPKYDPAGPLPFPAHSHRPAHGFDAPFR